MNIIYLGPSYEKYSSASYQYAFEKELKLISNNFFSYSKNGDISAKYIENEAGFIPDIIIYNHGWFNDDPVKPIKYANIIGSWTNRNIKHILMLNKEYARLEEKIEEINNYNFDMVFTHLHNCKKLDNANKNVIFMPLAFSPEESSESRLRELKDRKYDLFFSGILQNWNFKDTQSDIRKKIQKELFYTLFDIPFKKKIKIPQL